MGFKNILSTASIGIILLLAISSGFTYCLYMDVESSRGNTFGAWTSTLWKQTTEADFSAGVLSDVDVSSSPGDVIIEGHGDSVSWYDGTWRSRKGIVLNNSGSALSDYQVKVDLIYDNQMQPDFDDIRFVDSDGSTQLFCWLDDYTASTSATFWVRVPYIPPGNKTIYIYYGNDDAVSVSNGSQTFLFYDDFEEDDPGDVPQGWTIKDSNSNIWNFTNSRDYIYDSSKIEFEGGYAQLINNSAPEWWNGDWGYRVYLDVNTSSYNRTDSVITWNANFTSLLDNPALTFDKNSIRVIEYDPLGNILGERTSQFIKGSSYNASNKAAGDLIWLLNGFTPSNTSRYYYVYFDTTTNPKSEPEYTNISMNTNTTYANNGVWYEIDEKLHWKIHKTMGGLYNDISWNDSTSTYTYSTTDHWEFGTNIRPATDQPHMNASFDNMITDTPEVGPVRVRFYQHYSDGSYVETIYYKDQPWMKVIYHNNTDWNGNDWEVESVSEVGKKVSFNYWDSPDYQNAVMAGSLSSILYNVNMTGEWKPTVFDDSEWHDNPSKLMSNRSQHSVEWYFIYKGPAINTSTKAKPIIKEVITPVNVTLGTVSNPSYPSDVPSIQPVTGYSYDAICNFSSIPGPANQGEISYQISNDNISWYYHDGTSWVASSGFAQTNSIEEVESHIGSLEDDIGPGTFYFKAFLYRDGTQQVQLDELTVSKSTVEVRSDAGNKVLYDGNGGGGNIVAGNSSWTDIACRQMFRSIDGNVSHAGLVVHYTNETREIYGGIVNSTTTQLRERNESASWADGSGWNQIGGNWNISNVGTSWHMQELRVLNNTLEFYLDDVYVGNATLHPDAPSSGKTGFWSQYGEEGYRDEHIVRRYSYPEPIAVAGSKEYWYEISGYQKKITINHTMVEANLTDFPVLINLLSDTDLVTHAQADGDDILFTDSDNNKLSHEIEEYNSSTGKLIAWVKVPDLSNTTDTEIYMHYGNPTCESQENATNVWDSNFQMVQHMEETSGTHEDSTMQKNNLTPQGKLTQTATGIIGGADYYDGTDDYLSRTDSELNGDIPAKSTGSANNFTLSAWIKLDTSGNRHPIITKQGDWDNQMDRGFLFGVNETNTLEFQVFRGDVDPADRSEIFSTQSLSTDKWHYAVATYQYISDGHSQMRLFLNGMQNGSKDDAYGPPIENTRDFFIGRYYWGDSYQKYFKGDIDEVRISNTVRSQSWIKTSYNNQYSSSAFYDIGVECDCPTTTTGRIESQVFAADSENYNKKITINQTKVAGNLTDFPVLISLSADANLAAHAQNDGDDIFFITADATRLSHEIEEYNSSTGKLIAWVKVPNLSNTTDTDIYMHYGNSTCGSQENATGVWDRNYIMVQHMIDLNSTTTEDSTSNNYDGTKTNISEPLEVEGMVGKGQYFDGSNEK